MTHSHDEELIERVAKSVWDTFGKIGIDWPAASGAARDEAFKVAMVTVTAVRAYDAERRASVLDAAAVRHDPDDYRDLPVGLVEPVRFRGGLTEGPK